jgi:hypothetical protein
MGRARLAGQEQAMSPSSTLRASAGQARQRDPAGLSPRLPPWLRVALGGVIALGSLLRVVEPGTTVFCDDQARACALAEDVAAGHWESGGLVNSGRFRNPPGFVYLLAVVWSVRPHPLTLLYFTAVLNLVALAGSAYLCYRWTGAAAAWWGCAFFAASPWAIHYCRWIWALHLVFPAALIVYASLWAWLCRGRRWAALGVVVGLGLLVHIHLAGVVLVLAVALLCLVYRVRLPAVPLALGLILAAASLLPWLVFGHLQPPAEGRIGYRHVWRVVPAAAMSVSGLNWSLEFRGGYPDFARYLAGRRWPYEALMAIPPLLLAAGATSGLREVWRGRRERTAHRDDPAARVQPATSDAIQPLALVLGLVLLVPLAFVLLAIRTSPAYLPLWYPLPFVIMGWAARRFTQGGNGMRRRLLTALLLTVLLGQLAFFIDQLRYIKTKGGVPRSLLARSWDGLQADLAALTREINAGEIWVAYAGDSPIMDEATAYLFRHATWKGASPQRVLVHFRPPWEGTSWWEVLRGDTPPPAEAFLVRPWTGRQQRDGYLLRVPVGSSTAISHCPDTASGQRS